MLDDEDQDRWESLDTALDKLDLSRGYHYKHRDDSDYFEWATFGPRVKVRRSSRIAYAERRRAAVEALRQKRLAPKPKSSRRGRPPLAAAE